VQRASRYHIAEHQALLTCSAEDLIVHKAFADRPQDWLDVAGEASTSCLPESWPWQCAPCRCWEWARRRRDCGRR
jgi:hypothetical protein